MKIAIIGVGAVGGYFGGRLAESGHDVIFLSRGRSHEKLKSDGLKIYSPKGDIHLKKIYVTDNFKEPGKVDYIILGVKAWQVPEIAESLNPLIDEHTAILPLQNGVEAAETLVQHFTEKHVLGGMCRISAAKISANEINHFDVEPFIAFSELNNNISERTSKLLEILSSAGISAKIPDNIHSTIWEKYIFIAPVSSVGAVTRSPVGVLKELPETRTLLMESMQEIFNIASAKGIFLRDDIIQKTFEFIDKMAPATTASMQRDIMAGRPSELDSLIGAVLRMGKIHNIPTPVNKFIFNSLLPMELKARHKLR